MVNASPKYCIHVAFIIRADKLETIKYKIGNVERDIPIAYFYLVGLAKAGKKVLFEIIGQDGMCNNDQYKRSSNYVYPIFENSNNAFASPSGISMFENDNINNNYYTNTIYIKYKPKGNPLASI
jgi:hypothetical protein